MACTKKGGKKGGKKQMAGRPLKFKSIQELQERIDSYFDECDKTIIKRIKNKSGDLIYEVTKPYTITGLAEYLETNRETLCNYEEKEEYFDTIKNAKAKIEACYEERALLGDNNPVVSIFTLKNNFGWKDKSEVENLGQMSLDVTITDRINKVYGGDN